VAATPPQELTPPRETLSDSARAIHLLQRATYGIRPGDVEEVLRIGRDAWLERQVHPDQIPDPHLAARLQRFPAASMSETDLLAAYPPPRRSRAGDPPPSPSERRRMRQRSPNRIAADLAGAKLQRAVYSERQLEERMVDFWFNHFNVFFAKGPSKWLVSDYERTAIRPYVFGSFDQMLLAVASHPAMLVYLDNWRSMVPDSMNPRLARARDAGRRWKHLTESQREKLIRSGRVSRQLATRLEAGGALRPGGGRRTRGLNENYARELMELHTLGVDGGYTQADVIEVARAFTGWTITRSGGRRRETGRRREGARRGPMDGSDESGGIRFAFRPEIHDPGEKIVLGHRLSAGHGMEDGRDVLHLLAHHPATARHIATQLVQYFVADEPSPELVDRIADVFLSTGGDLREVTRALFTSEEFYDPAVVDAKVRTPFELMAASLRVTDADAGPSRKLLQQLRAFEHFPYLNPVPTGYPQTSEAWVNGGAMLQRMNFGLALAAGKLDGVSLPASDGPERLGSLLQTLLPGEETATLESVIAADLADSPNRSTRASASRALGLALGSPEFQRH